MLAGPLRSRAAALNLSNLLVIPHQPYARVPDIYGASDLCVVAQAIATGSDAIPSKVYRIMACDRPIVAATDAQSDLAQLVTAAGAGRVVAPESADALAAAVRSALADPQSWRARAAAGRRHVAEHYMRSAVSRQYDALLREVVRRDVAGTATDSSPRG
jgi:glycosyltransferase involved in cell wall biosynthesis